MYERKVFRPLILPVALATVLGALGPLHAEGDEKEATPQEVIVPIGTKVYAEIMERVESKKKKWQVGDPVRARVWRDVVIDGVVVFPRGAPIDMRVSFLKTAKVAGIKGKLEVEAVSMRLGGGDEIPMAGGYGKKGRGNIALAATLSAFVAWPLIFITGKKAVLEPGTLVDTYTDQEYVAEVKSDRPGRTLDVSSLIDQDLSVEILYEEMETEEKLKDLPMRVTVCVEEIPALIVIDTINGETIETPMTLELGTFEMDDDCHVARATVPLKPLVKQFRRGINRFDVAFAVNDERVASEVILDAQF